MDTRRNSVGLSCGLGLYPYRICQASQPCTPGDGAAGFPDATVPSPSESAVYGWPQKRSHTENAERSIKRLRASEGLGRPAVCDERNRQSVIRRQSSASSSILQAYLQWKSPEFLESDGGPDAPASCIEGTSPAGSSVAQDSQLSTSLQPTIGTAQPVASGVWVAPHSLDVTVRPFLSAVPEHAPTPHLSRLLGAAHSSHPPIQRADWGRPQRREHQQGFRDRSEHWSQPLYGHRQVHQGHQPVHRQHRLHRHAVQPLPLPLAQASQPHPRRRHGGLKALHLLQLQQPSCSGFGGGTAAAPPPPPPSSWLGLPDGAFTAAPAITLARSATAMLQHPEQFGPPAAQRHALAPPPPLFFQSDALGCHAARGGPASTYHAPAHHAAPRCVSLLLAAPGGPAPSRPLTLTLAHTAAAATVTSPVPAPLPSIEVAREGIFLACKALGVSLDTTARLGIHIWDRIHGMVRLVVSVRWPAAGATAAAGGRGSRQAGAASLERLYAMAALWLAVKLEETRNSSPSVAAVCVLARTLPGCLVEAELRVLRWCEWAPYAGFLPYGTAAAAAAAAAVAGPAW